MKFQKGHPGFKKKGTKHKETLLKEERRAIFDKEMSEMFVEKIHKARPEYVLDQFLGKPTEHHEVVVKTEPTERVLQYIDAITKQRGDTGTD